MAAVYGPPDPLITVSPILSLAPSGTIGVAISDNAESMQSEPIQRHAIDYLVKCGLPAHTSVFKGMGSSTGIVEWIFEHALEEAFVLAFVYYWGHLKRLARLFYVPKAERERQSNLPVCHIQLQDRRIPENQNATQLVEMIPDLLQHISSEYPNRKYSFIIWSSVPGKVRYALVTIHSYDSIHIVCKQMARKLNALDGKPIMRNIALTVIPRKYRPGRVSVKIDR